MPPKAKMYKSTGKSTLQSSKQPSSNNSETSELQSQRLNPEIEQQFELELCWCIQQLQTALKSGKLNQKQVQDHTKALNTLMNNSAPLIKKRQVMRLSFGDYRAKMQAEEEKLKNRVMRVKVTPAKPSNKSVFIKKSQIQLNSGNTFKFNFDKPEEDIADEVSSIKLDNGDCGKEEETLKSSKPFHFTTSNNEFKFNFNVDSIGEQ